MAFKKPEVNVIKPDIKNLSIYLRSTKKFGKSTLFRDVILAKYGDPSRGLLVGCGNEIGYKMLDNLNVTQVTSYKDMVELEKYYDREYGINEVVDKIDKVINEVINEMVKEEILEVKKYGKYKNNRKSKHDKHSKKSGKISQSK